MSRRPGRWVDEVDPVSVAVECGGARHVVSWRRGKLVLEDHDLGAELAASALGGPLPGCMELLKTWRNRTIWSVATQPDPPGFIRRRPRLAMSNELVPVRELGVARAWARSAARHPNSDSGEHLYRYLRKRALAPLLAAAADAQVRYDGGRVSFAEVRLLASTEDDDEPEVFGRVDKRQTALVVSLSPRWLSEVWARGIGAVDGRFIARVTDAAAWPASIAVRAVMWSVVDGEPGAREPFLADARVRLTAEGYALDAA